jgi:hypothetical protein
MEEQSEAQPEAVPFVQELQVGRKEAFPVWRKRVIKGIRKVRRDYVKGIREALEEI